MDRPTAVKGTTEQIKTGCGKLYLTISNPEEYQEIFLRLGKCGGCTLSFLDGIGRLISMGLNQPLTKELIVKAFIGIRCPNPINNGDSLILSCLDGIAQSLKEDGTLA